MSTEGTVSLIKTLRCSSCGAPLRPSAESILTICSFCGEITAETNVDPHIIVKPLPFQAPEGPGEINKMELILVPFFEVKGTVNLDATGYQRRERTETKTVTRGGKTYTETERIIEYRPWRVTHYGNHAVRFLARQEITMFGAGELISSVANNIGGEPTPFSASYIKALASHDTSKMLEALSPEWGQDEASKKASEMVYEAAYARAKSEMHEVFDTKVQFKTFDKPMLIHEPLLLVRRKIQGKMFRAAYNWGNGKLLREEQPIKNKRLMVAIAVLSLFLIPIFAQLGYDFEASGVENGEILLGVFIALGIFALIIAIVLLVRAYKPHKIKSSGAGVSLLSFQSVAPPPTQTPIQSPRIKQEQKSPKFCPKCGDPLDSGQKFCEKCGQDVTR